VVVGCVDVEELVVEDTLGAKLIVSGVYWTCTPSGKTQSAPTGREVPPLPSCGELAGMSAVIDAVQLPSGLTGTEPVASAKNEFAPIHHVAVAPAHAFPESMKAFVALRTNVVGVIDIPKPATVSTVKVCSGEAQPGETCHIPGYATDIGIVAFQSPDASELTFSTMLGRKPVASPTVLSRHTNTVTAEDGVQPVPVIEMLRGAIGTGVSRHGFPCLRAVSVT